MKIYCFLLILFPRAYLSFVFFHDKIKKKKSGEREREGGRTEVENSISWILSDPKKTEKTHNWSNAATKAEQRQSTGGEELVGALCFLAFFPDLLLWELLDSLFFFVLLMYAYCDEIFVCVSMGELKFWGKKF